MQNSKSLNIFQHFTSSPSTGNLFFVNPWPPTYLKSQNMMRTETRLGSSMLDVPFPRQKQLVPQSLGNYNCRGLHIGRWNTCLSAEESDALDVHEEKMLNIQGGLLGPREQRSGADYHNQMQREAFDNAVNFFSSKQAVPRAVVPRLEKISSSVTVEKGQYVLDVGCGTGALLPFLAKNTGVYGEDKLVGLDLSSGMVGIARERNPNSGFFTGDFMDFKSIGDAEFSATATVVDVSASENEADTVATNPEVGAIFFNAVFGNLWDQPAALAHCCELLPTGGNVVISHPMGSTFVKMLKKKDNRLVPHLLPTQEQLEAMVANLPLEIKSFEGKDGVKDLYLAVLQRVPVSPLTKLLCLRGKVAHGYGRGSRKLGIPTANLPESNFLTSALGDVPAGVYCGWALVEQNGNGAHKGPFKAVVNIGFSPTFEGKENPEKIVEAHLVHDFEEDFYDKQMRLVLVGFKRFEKKFSSFPELLANIRQDVKDCSEALDCEQFKSIQDISFLTKDDIDSHEQLVFIDINK